METPNPAWTVYVHITPDGKMYAGITSIKPWKRWGYGHGYKGIPKFYQACQKFGWKNIQHVIFASGLTEAEAKNMEKILITKLNLTDPAYGYNTAIGKETAVETKKKLSESIHRFYENNHPGPNPRLGTGVLQTMQYKHNDAYAGGKDVSEGNRRRVKCMDTGIEYSCVADAAKLTGINAAHIYSNALGARVDAGGMQWEYTDAPHQKTHTRSESYKANKRGIKNGRAKPVRCIETGECFATCQDLANSLGINKGVVTNFMKRKKEHIGLHYEYISKGEYLNGTDISES